MSEIWRWVFEILIGLALLGSVVAGGPAGVNVFALETAGSAQRMEFDP